MQNTYEVRRHNVYRTGHEMTRCLHCGIKKTKLQFDWWYNNPYSANASQAEVIAHATLAGAAVTSAGIVWRDHRVRIVRHGYRCVLSGWLGESADFPIECKPLGRDAGLPQTEVVIGTFSSFRQISRQRANEAMRNRAITRATSRVATSLHYMNLGPFRPELLKSEPGPPLPWIVIASSMWASSNMVLVISFVLVAGICVLASVSPRSFRTHAGAHVQLARCIS